VNNSRAVPAAVTSQAADVGLAFASDATQASWCQTQLRVPISQAAAQYVATVINRGGQQLEAAEFPQFLVSLTAARCFCVRIRTGPLKREFCLLASATEKSGRLRDPQQV
jgi:ABC-type molybdate transport system substrate-binding protein